jgi:hypothetical protein
MLYETFMAWETTLPGSKEFFLNETLPKRIKTMTTKDKNKIPFLSFFLSDPVKGAGTLVLIFLVENKTIATKKTEMQTIPHFIFEKKSFTRLHLMKMRYHRLRVFLLNLHFIFFQSER